MTKILIVLSLLIASINVFAVCSSPSSATRTNFVAGEVLTAARLNTELNTIYDHANELPGDCIESETITSTQIENGTIVSADISASAAISRIKLADQNYSISANVISVSATSTSYTDLSGLSAAITTTGAPVEAYLVPGIDTDSAIIELVPLSGGKVGGNLKLVRGSTDIGIVTYLDSATSSSSRNYIPASSVRFFDTPASGSYTYKIQGSKDASGYTDYLGIQNAKLMVRELK